MGNRLSEEDIYRANSVNLPLFLIQRGETLKKVGSIYKFIYSDSGGTHDSITMNDNRWYDHKNQRGGYPVKFMQEYYGMKFRDAVLTLLGGQIFSSEMNYSQNVQPTAKKEFILPEPNSDMRRAFAYLTKQRFISSKIISEFAKENKIYEEKAHHNIVFVGTDENGVPRQAHQRSSSSYGNAFRITVGGSDTKYSFSHFGNSGKLFVFEAPIDMLSFITLYPKGWQDHSFIAMNGVYESAVLNALENHKNLSDIYICTDNDIGGIEAADRLRDILRGKGYENILRILSENKDFNEDLKSRSGIEPLPAVPHRRKEIFVECVSPFKFEPFDITRTAECLMAYRKHNSYIAAADIVLRTAAILIMREEKGSPAEIYEKLKERLTKGYKSYADKGTAAAKDKCFGSSILAVKEKLKQFPAAAEQRKETVDALMELADAAVRCETDKRLTEEQSMSDQDEQPRIRMN